MGALSTFSTNLNAEQSLDSLTRSRVTPRRLKSRLTEPRKKPSTVGGLLKSIQACAFPAVLLGECADGLPFLVELGDPEMGATLVSCEKGTGKTHQLQVMAESATRLNAPSDVQIGVLTFKPDEWHSWERSAQHRKYLQGIYAWYDPWAEGLIQNLVDLAEARRGGDRTGADVLFIVDDLNFIEELSYEAQVNLHWLLEYGSQSHIWVAGAINAHLAADFSYWVDPFRTRIIGRVNSTENAGILGLVPNVWAGAVEPGTFRVRAGTEWRTYRLPLLGD